MITDANYPDETSARISSSFAEESEVGNSQVSMAENHTFNALYIYSILTQYILRRSWSCTFPMTEHLVQFRWVFEVL
jgi:hypothetical protein